MFGQFTALIKKYEHAYIGRKIELNIERIDMEDNLFYYSGVLRITQDGCRRYAVGNTKHLGNTPLNTEKTLQTMMLSRLVADIYTQNFKCTEDIPILDRDSVSSKISAEKIEEPNIREFESFDELLDRDLDEFEESDFDQIDELLDDNLDSLYKKTKSNKKFFQTEENLGEWEYFDYTEERDDVDVATYGVDDCIIWNRKYGGEQRFREKLDEELEKYFYGRVPQEIPEVFFVDEFENCHSDITNPFSMPDLFGFLSVY